MDETPKSSSSLLCSAWSNIYLCVRAQLQTWRDCVLPPHRALEPLHKARRGVSSSVWNTQLMANPRPLAPGASGSPWRGGTISPGNKPDISQRSKAGDEGGEAGKLIWGDSSTSWDASATAGSCRGRSGCGRPTGTGGLAAARAGSGSGCSRKGGDRTIEGCTGSTGTWAPASTAYWACPGICCNTTESCYGASLLGALVTHTARYHGGKGREVCGRAALAWSPLGEVTAREFKLALKWPNKNNNRSILPI